MMLMLMLMMLPMLVLLLLLLLSLLMLLLIRMTRMRSLLLLPVMLWFLLLLLLKLPAQAAANCSRWRAQLSETPTIPGSFKHAFASLAQAAHGCAFSFAVRLLTVSLSCCSQW